MDLGQINCLTGILAIWGLWVLNPGPNFLATVQISLSQSRRAGIMVAMGITFGTGIWALASLWGLGMLLQQSVWLHKTLKLLGALYLLYLGVKSLLFSASGVTSNCSVGSRSDRSAFMHGLIVDLCNPKAALFFTSLFALTVPENSPVWFKGLLTGTVMLVPCVWFCLLAFMANLSIVERWLTKLRIWIRKLAGALFITFACKLAWDD